MRPTEYRIRNHRVDSHGEKGYRSTKDGLSDWKCNKCSYINRHYRNKCNRCHSLKLQIDHKRYRKEDHRLNEQKTVTGNDWVCTNRECTFVNKCYSGSCIKCNCLRDGNESKNINVDGSATYRTENDSYGSNRNLMAQFGLPTSFGPDSFALDKCEIKLQPNKTQSPNEDNNNDAMAALGLPTCFANPNRNAVDVDPSSEPCENIRSTSRKVPAVDGSATYRTDNDSQGSNRALLAPFGLPTSFGRNTSPLDNCKIKLQPNETKSPKDINNDAMVALGLPTCFANPNRNAVDVDTSCDPCGNIRSTSRKVPAKGEWMTEYKKDLQYYQDHFVEGDWYCKPCGNLRNRQTHSACYQCHQPRNRKTSNASYNPLRENREWNCPVRNTGNPDSGFQCTPYYNNQNQMKSEYKSNSTKTKHLLKDWWCTTCRSSNLFDRITCFRCRYPRPKIQTEQRNTHTTLIATDQIDYKTCCSPKLNPRRACIADEGQKEAVHPPISNPCESFSTKLDNIEGSRKIINKTSKINPDVFLPTCSPSTKSLTTDHPAIHLDSNSHTLKVSKIVNENTTRMDHITHSTKTTSRRMSSPAFSNCSPFSVRTTSVSPLHRNLANNSDTNETTVYADHRESEEKLCNERNPDDISSPKTALQIAKKSSCVSNLGFRFHGNGNRCRASSSMSGVSAASRTDLQRHSLPHKRRPVESHRQVEKEHTIYAKGPKLAESTAAVNGTSWSQYYNDQSRKQEEKKKRDIENLRPVRNRLAELAGGYLTGDGTSTGKFEIAEHKENSSGNVQIECIDLVEPDLEHESDIIILPSESSKNIAIIHLDSNSHNDNEIEEHNEISRALRSNLPDDEKQAILAKYGIKVKNSECDNSKKNQDDDFWLVDKVLEIEKALLCDKTTTSNEKRDNSIEIVTLE